MLVTQVVNISEDIPSGKHLINTLSRIRLGLCMKPPTMRFPRCPEAVFGVRCPYLLRVMPLQPSPPGRRHQCLPGFGTRGPVGGCAPVSCRAEPGVYRPGMLLRADGRRCFAVSAKVQGPTPFPAGALCSFAAPGEQQVLDKLVQAEP